MGGEVQSVKSADGVPIAFDVCGRGSGAAAAVFVHGWAGRREHWDEQLEAFADDRLVVRLDLAGHGASGRARDRWSVGAFADDVVAVVEALGLDRVVLLGHSLGGSVIVEAARRLAGRVVRLVGVDTWSAIGVRRSVAACISSESFRPKDPAVLAAFGIDNVVLPGTGHYLMLERPQAFNELLTGVLAR